MKLLNVSVALTVVLLVSTVKGIRDAHNATQNQFPYHALIDVDELGNGDYNRSEGSYSGTVISSRLVITSYIVVENGKKFRIRLGALNASSEPVHDSETTITRYPPGKEKLIALLYIPDEIQINLQIQPVTLPTPNYGASDVFAQATGYKTRLQETDRLRFVNMQNIPVSDCVPDQLSPVVEFQKTYLCVRGVSDEKPKGILCGELGVPLVIPENRTLIGIYAFSDNDCRKGGPNAFIKIKPFVNWINEMISASASGTVS